MQTSWIGAQGSGALDLDLGAVYDVAEIRVWNHGGASGGRGIEGVEFLRSVDNKNLFQLPGAPRLAHNALTPRADRIRIQGRRGSQRAGAIRRRHPSNDDHSDCGSCHQRDRGGAEPPAAAPHVTQQKLQLGIWFDHGAEYPIDEGLAQRSRRGPRAGGANGAAARNATRHQAGSQAHAPALRGPDYNA